MLFCKNMLTHLLLGYGLSFIGSLPFGIINMLVAHTAIRKKLAAALWVAAGAVTVEFFQVIIALKFTWLFDENGEYEMPLKIVALAVFITAGIYFLFFAKSQQVESAGEAYGKRRHEFAKGVMTSLLNVMAIPFWIFYGTFLSANGLLEQDNLYVLIFALGTVLGTFSLLACYALLGSRILKKHEKVTWWVNRTIGMVLLSLGLYQLAGLSGWI